MRIDSILAIVLVCAGSVGQGAWAADAPDPTFKRNGDSLKLLPPVAHHFNDKAPATADLDGAPVQLTLKEAAVSLKLPSAAANGTVHVSAYLCDDAKTYCVKKSVNYLLASAAQAAALSVPSGVPAKNSLAGSKKYFEKDTGFLVNDVAKAFARAKREKKPLLIDFFGIWCPPCNHLDAMVYRSDDFRTKVRDAFVLLKVDADLAASGPLKQRYAIQGLPTIVFATPDGDEIRREIGFHPLDEVLKTSDYALAHKSEGIKELSQLSGLGNAEASFRLAELYLDRNEPAKALPLVEKLKAALEALKDPRLKTIYKAEFKVAIDQKNLPAASEVAGRIAELFPDSVLAFESFESLADLQESLEPDSKRFRAPLESALSAIQGFSAKTGSNREATEYTPADLKEETAELYDRLGIPDKAHQAFLDCADAYLQEAKQEGTEFPRGPNLERGYCLAKAGNLSEAESIFRQGISKFPAEFTFHRSLAGLLMDYYKKPQEALDESRIAMKLAYGNQRYKVIFTEVKALEGLGKIKEGLTAIERELKAFPAGAQIQSLVKIKEKLTAKRDALRAKLKSPAPSA